MAGRTERTPSRFLIPALALAVLGLAGPPAAAQRRGQQAPTRGPVDIWGARTLSPGQHVFTVGGGWPSVFFQYDLAPSQNFGLGLRGDLYYGSPFYGFDTALGTGFYVPMRIHLWGQQRHGIDIGIGLKPGITIGEGELFLDRAFYRDDFGFALHLGDPAFLFSITPTPKLTVFGRAELQLALVIGPDDPGDPGDDDAFFEATFGIVGGVEFHLSPGVNLFVLTGIGPGFQPRGCYRYRGDRYCDDRGLFFRFAFGASFAP